MKNKELTPLDAWRDKLRIGGADFLYTMAGLKNEIQLCDWGSCQYTSAKVAYDAYFKIRSELIPIDEVLGLFGLKLNHTPRSMEEAVEAFKNSEWESTSLDDPYTTEELKEIYVGMEKIKDIEGCLEHCRNYSWDLWSAMLGIPIDCGLHLVQLEGQGTPPIDLNDPIMEGYLTGIQCALLKEYTFVDNEEAFSNFDT